MEEACLGRGGRPTFTGARALPQPGAAACKETYLTFVAASTVRGTVRGKETYLTFVTAGSWRKRIETPALMESCRRWRQL